MNLFFGLEALPCPKYSLGSYGVGRLEEVPSDWLYLSQCWSSRAWLKGGTWKGFEGEGERVGGMRE